jgi:RNA-directed DNA polymerase
LPDGSGGAKVRAAIAARLEGCRLELHPVKTKIVYCKDDDRRRRYGNEKFDFLAYGFQPRRSKNRFGKYFINFSPAISEETGKAIRGEIHSWKLHLRSDKAIEARLVAVLRAILIARRCIRTCVNWTAP